VPFAFGGGIRSVEAMKEIIQAGAEKVVINTAAVESPELIAAGAEKFGSQCIVVSIDARKRHGGYEVFTRSGSRPTGRSAVEWAREVEALGAGEVLLNSILHEGMMNGYDIDLLKAVSAAVKIPVIASGGAGKLEHFPPAVLEGGASAVAAGSIYHYTKFTPNMVKGALHRAGIPVRRYPDESYDLA
jgi:cyclase